MIPLREPWIATKLSLDLFPIQLQTSSVSIEISDNTTNMIKMEIPVARQLMNVCHISSGLYVLSVDIFTV